MVFVFYFYFILLSFLERRTHSDESLYEIATMCHGKKYVKNLIAKWYNMLKFNVWV